MFDLVIVDECHHIAAATFSKSIRLFRARYTMGLSATLKRADGNEEAIFWMLGYPVAVCTRPVDASEASGLTIRMLYMNDTHVEDSFTKSGTFGGNTIAFPKMLTQLLQKPVRIERLSAEIHRAYAEGRDILVISERIDYLDRLAAKLSELGLASAKYVGETSKRKREQRDKDAAEVRILLTTRAMASEGFDRASIDTVVLATPLKRGATLEQSIGRCQRQGAQGASVRSRLVVDVCDLKTSVFASMARGRESYYQTAGFCLERVRCDENSSQPELQKFATK
jgi:superfamily II DNA or RNA helicase